MSDSISYVLTDGTDSGLIGDVGIDLAVQSEFVGYPIYEIGTEIDGSSDANSIIQGDPQGTPIVIDEYDNTTLIGTLSFELGGFYVHLGESYGYPNQYDLYVESYTLTGCFPCFTPGTLIDSPDGPIAVQHVAPGAVITLANGDTATVKWVGRRNAREARVIRFAPHSLGHNTPRRHLCTSHDHAMFVDGVLVPAQLLVNGLTVTEERWPTVRFYHVELEAHGILLAEGAPAESYLDTGNRRQFGNCPLTYDDYIPGTDACAEVVVAGPRLERARASLAGLLVA